MVRFRSRKEAGCNPLAKKLTKNLAGGPAIKQSDKLELVSLLLTSFVADSYYDKATDQLKRLSHLVATIPDKEFIAKAAIYARTEFGMRSIAHALIGELAIVGKDMPWLKHAIASAIHRPDDILEIVAYYLAHYKDCGYTKGLSAALRKGIVLALSKFDAYQLAKYRGEKSAVKMVDVINLVHPKPTGDDHPLSLLVSGKLKSKETWESKLSRAGQIADCEEDLKDAKKDAWHILISTHKIGYFALLRNLRNIIEQAPDIIVRACEMLIDRNLIKKSLVLPFRYVTALDEIMKMPGDLPRLVIMALNTAADIALDNVPKFDGSTLIALDVSGSMAGQPLKIGSLFAAALCKSSNADLLIFSDAAKMVQYNLNDPVLTFANKIESLAMRGGTNFRGIFAVQQKYDRVIILSDMQAWVDSSIAQVAAKEYMKRTGADPFIHTIDLAGKGTMQFPEDKVCSIAGFSEKIFSVLGLVEQDKNALLHAIENVQLM